MAKKKSVDEVPRQKPAMTPEARENQLIALATDLAEDQLLNGTASTQVIVHYLRLGSSKELLEKEMLAQKTKLVTAQTEKIRSDAHSEELYAEAMQAMRQYAGKADHDEYGALL